MQSINIDTNKTDGIRQRVEKMEEIEVNDSLVCPAPKSMKIEVSASCNLRCSFCYHKSSERKGLMTMEDFETAIKVASDEGIKQVGLLFLGEPTLNPDLPEMINMAKQKYHIPYVFITSNGVMSEDTLKKVLDTDIDSIKWSINHSSQGDFMAGTGVDGFDRLMNNVKLASKLRRPNTKLYASTAVYDVNNVPQQLKDFVDKQVKPYVYEHYYFKLNNQGGLIKDNHFSRSGICNRLPVVPCPRLFNNTYITHDLQVAMCCSAFTPEFYLGSLREQNFQDIWNGERMKKLRMAHLNNDLESTICGRKK